MRLRTNLFLLLAVAMAPLTAVAIIVGAVLVHHERQALEREAIGRARSAMSAIDAELRGSVTSALALASSANLADGNLQAFHQEAMRVLASQPGWLNIGLATPARIPLMDANRRWGAHAQFVTHDNAFEQAVKTGRPAIGDVRSGPPINEPAPTLQFPIIFNESVQYVLSVPIKSSSLEAVLRAQQIPTNWVIALVDRDQKFIARIPQAAVGVPISESFKAAIRRAPQGFFAGRTIEGMETYTPYVTSAESGWVLGIAMPAEIVQASAWRASLLIAGGLILALALGIGHAWFMARRISTPIAALAARSQVWGNPSEGDDSAKTTIEEIKRLDEALQGASRSIADRQSQLEAHAHLLSQSEQRLAAVLQHAPVGIGMANREGRWVVTNPAMFRFAPEAIPSRDPISFERWHAVDESGCPLPRERWPGARALRGEIEPGIEFLYRGDDEKEIWTRLAAAPIFDSAGTVTGAVVAIQDIDESHRVHNALEEKERELRELDRRKDQFLAMLAHELRNPLAPIVTALELLRRTDLDASVNSSMRDIMDRQVRHMVRLVDDLLDVSRISRGKLEIKPKPICIKSVIDQALEASAPWFKTMKQNLAVNLPATSPWVNGDAVRLTQLLVNLLGNASKYTLDGGNISLDVVVDGSGVAIAVKDNGIGIDQALLPHVFELFYQGDQSLERSKGGLGIGLTLVHSIAELHGGSVKAYSDGRGKGSKFVVRLPTLAVPSREAVADEPAMGAPPGSNILIADDNKDAAEALSILLRRSGHRVHVAHDGLQAAEEATRLRPAVALLDIAMPRLNGYELARRIRAYPWGQEIFLIAITGFGQENDSIKAQASGFDAHLIKPVDFDSLNRLLHRALAA